MTLISLDENKCSNFYIFCLLQIQSVLKWYFELNKLSDYGVHLHQLLPYAHGNKNIEVLFFFPLYPTIISGYFWCEVLHTLSWIFHQFTSTINMRFSKSVISLYCCSFFCIVNILTSLLLLLGIPTLHHMSLHSVFVISTFLSIFPLVFRTPVLSKKKVKLFYEPLCC